MITLRGIEKLNREQLTALIDKIKAIVYARVSSDGQIDNYSIESQIEMCAKDAINKLKVSEEEILVCVEEGESGDNPNRPMLNYVLFLLEKSVGKTVVFLHPNRLSRHLQLQQNIAHKIWELGCDLHFVEFDLDKDSAESMFMFNIQGSVSQYNKAKILADTKRGRKTKLNNGKIPGINRVYGYTFDKDNDILIENEEEKEVYLKMVDMVVNQNKSGSEVARILSKRYQAPKGSKWYQATVSRILRNRIYLGFYFYGKTEIVQSHGNKKIVDKPESEWYKIPIPQYIDEFTFERLQLKLDALAKNSVKSGRPSESYLLKGLARCGRCGAAVTSGVTTKTKNGLLKYYTCTRKSKKSYDVGTGDHNPVCRGRNWRVDKVDEIVWERVKQLIQNPEEILRQIAERNSDVEKLNELKNKQKLIEKDLADKNQAIERYLDLYATGFIKTKQALEEKLGNLNEVVEELEKNIFLIKETIKSSSMANDQISLFVSLLDKYRSIIESDVIEVDDKKMLVNVIIEKVVFHEDELEIIMKFDGGNNDPNGTDKHKNLNAGQGDGLDFYVSDSLQVSKHRTVTQLNSKWIEYEGRLPELMHLYHKELLTFEEMGQATGINWWNIKQLFKNHNVKRINVKERNELKKFNQTLTL